MKISIKTGWKRFTQFAKELNTCIKSSSQVGITLRYGKKYNQYLQYFDKFRILAIYGYSI